MCLFISSPTTDNELFICPRINFNRDTVHENPSNQINQVWMEFSLFEIILFFVSMIISGEVLLAL